MNSNSNVNNNPSDMAHYAQFRDICRRYSEAWGQVTVESIKRKELEALDGRVRRVVSETQLAPVAPATLPARKVLTLGSSNMSLVAKSGDDLFAKRDQEGDCYVEIHDSKGNHRTTMLAHKAQLAPLSDKFLFSQSDIGMQKPTLVIEYDGSEEECSDLLRFMYTGMIKSGPYCSSRIAALQAFGAKYGINALQHKLAFTPQAPDIYRQIKAIRDAASEDEVHEIYQQIAKVGLPTYSKKTINTLIKVLFYFKSNDPQLDSYIEELRLLRDNSNFSTDKKQTYKPLFNKAIHTTQITPFLQLCLTNAAHKSADSILKALAEFEDGVYCVEPPMAVFYHDGHLYGVSLGYIQDVTGAFRSYYIQAHPDNPGSIDVLGKKLLPGELHFSKTDLSESIEFTFNHNDCQIEQSSMPPSIYTENELHKVDPMSVEFARAEDGYKLCQELLETCKKFRAVAQEILSNKGKITRENKNVLKEFEPDNFTPFKNITVKTASELVVKAGSILYQFTLPNSCLAETRLSTERKSTFKFEDGEVVLPHMALKGKTAHADAGFGLNEESSFTFTGKTSDFENRAFISYIKGEPLPNEPVSPNQLAALIMLADRSEAPKLMDLASECYGHLHMLTGQEALKLEYFTYLQRIGRSELLHTLLEAEGGFQNPGQWIERVPLLTEKTRLFTFKTLCQKSSVKVICHVLAWALTQNNDQMHKEICDSLQQRTLSFKEYIKLVKLGFVHKNFRSSKISPEDADQFMAACRFLVALRKNTEKQRDANFAARRELMQMYYYDPIVSQANLLDDPKHVWAYISWMAKFTQSANQVNDKVNQWISQQKSEEPILKLKELIRNKNFSEMGFSMTLVIELSETFIDKRTGEKIIDDSTFRKQILNFNSALLAAKKALQQDAPKE